MFKKTKKFHVTAELQEELENIPLKTQGTVPSWLSGTLIRNGPITVTVNGQTNKHWFDGLAMLHAFSFQDGKVKYSNKFLRSNAYHAVFEKGSLNYLGFAVDPCRSLFKKWLTFFMPHHPEIQNANINVAKLADEYVALFEVPLPVRFDPKTLETLGVFDYQDMLPKDNCWESAHPHHDNEHKRTLNYLIQFGRSSYYTLYSMEDRSSERKTLAEVPVEQPSYMHSFAVTENYIILTEFPLVAKPLDFLIKNQPFIKNFSWQPQRGTRFLVVSKKEGKVVSEHVTEPFFAFHHANAFEKEGKIFLDIVTYNDASIVIGESFILADADKPPTNNYHSRLKRFSLSLDNGEIVSEILSGKSAEFPRINEKLDGKPYRYLYLAAFSDEMRENKGLLNSEGLYKINTETKEILTWSQEGCSAGEPVFIAAPDALKEDDGVVLALIIDHIHHASFLLILDAKSFKEIGRTNAPHVIPPGLHGQYFKGP